ncbi:MAG: hypothetical protein KJ709_00260 [Nanoarchaeota archaeon]|nr:hypothetical protein [Nanoarchaeota archaeon]
MAKKAVRKVNKVNNLHGKLPWILIIGMMVIVFLVGMMIGTTKTDSGNTVGQRIYSISAGPSGGSEINAHECTADGVCEMTSATISDSLNVGTLWGEPLFKVTEDGLTNIRGVVEFDSEITFQDSSDVYFYSHADFFEDAVFHDVADFWEGITVMGPSGSDFTGGVSFADFVRLVGDDTLRVDAMEGDGTAYVCVNSTGHLIRSDTPCNGQAGGLNGQDVLDILNDCAVRVVDDSSPFATESNCNEVCEDIDMTCMLGHLEQNYETNFRDRSELFGCTMQWSGGPSSITTYNCVCCSP